MRINGIVPSPIIMTEKKDISVNRQFSLALVAGILITGCAVAPTPQNANEYRAGILKGGFGTSFETYEVNKPYANAVSTLKTKSDQCLNISLVETQCINNSCTDRDITYIPTLLSGKTKTELHVQWKRDPDDAIYLGGKPPASGMYIAVVDLTPVSKTKTKVDVYAPNMVFTMVPTAVKNWLNGTNMGCPDFSQGN